VLAVLGELRRELRGAGPLEALLADPGVTDVLVNGPDQVWVDRGDGLSRSTVAFADETAVRQLAVRLVAACGRRLDAAQPFADASLPDGTRLHAVLAPVARTGTCLSLRVLRRSAVGLDDLVALGTMDVATAQVLRAVMAARLAVVITGGTGSGKTTLLGALLSGIDPAERVVIVEDTPELSPDHPHVVALQTRPPNIEGSGQIDLRTLVRQALRMRPDRLVIGEVRGAEVVDLLAALNTGHQGGATMVHANAAGDLTARLEALGSMGGVGREALHSQAVAALQVVVHLGRDRSGARRVHEVAVATADGAGRLGVTAALTCASPGRTGLVGQPWPAKVGAGAARLRGGVAAAGVALPALLLEPGSRDPRPG
jgi:pilus assembly protein CpaF